MPSSPLPFSATRPTDALTLGQPHFGQLVPRRGKRSDTSIHPEVAAYQAYVRQIHPNIKMLSPQQSQAIQALAEGNSPLCNLPTGSGKTLIAEYPIYKVLAWNNTHPNEPKQRVVFTLPHKAALNEKFLDFSKRYGEANVGLMTGDKTINRNAAVLLMTAEVWTNILARQQENDPLIRSVRYAVQDEYHFISDKDRGTTWEEATLLTPNTIQQVFLSASISNATEMVDWLNQVRASKTSPSAPIAVAGFPDAVTGQVTLVQTHHRPVPLRHGFIGYNRDGQHILVEMFQNDEREANYYRHLHDEVSGLQQRIETLTAERDLLIESRERYIESHWGGGEKLLDYRIDVQEKKLARIRERIEAIEESLAVQGYIQAYGAHLTQKEKLERVYKRLEKAGVTPIAEHPEYQAAKKAELTAAAALRRVRREVEGRGYRIPKAREIEERQQQAGSALARFLKNGMLDPLALRGMHQQRIFNEITLGKAYQQRRKRVGQLNVAWRRETTERLAAEGQKFRDIGNYNDEIGSLKRQLESASNRLAQYDRRDLLHKREIVENSLRQVEESLETLMDSVEGRPGGQPTLEDKRALDRLHKNRKALQRSLEQTESQVATVQHQAPFNTGFRESFAITGKLLQDGQVALVDPVGAVKALQAKKPLGRDFSLMPALFVVYSKQKCFDMAQKLWAAVPEVLPPGANQPALATEPGKADDGTLKPLITPEERGQIDRVIASYIKKYEGLALLRRYRDKTAPPPKPDQTELGKTEPGNPEALAKREATLFESPVLPLLRKGIAIHHANLTPDEKGLVEALVDRGLAKAVFATDTMTVALDAPFQTVILTGYQRAGEVVDRKALQQAGGRAGRLGKHQEGFFILPYPKTLEAETEREKLTALMDMLMSPPEPLRSQLDFSTYQVLNLLDHHDTETVEALIEQSLGVYQATQNPDASNVPLVNGMGVSAKGGNPASEAFIKAYHERRDELVQAGLLDENYQLTGLGKLARKIPGTNHLLIAKALKAGVFQTLQPQHLALLVSMIAVESRDKTKLPVNPLTRETWSPGSDTFPPEVSTAIEGLREAYTGLESVSDEAFINPEHAHIIHHWLTYHDWVPIQRHARRGEVFEVIRRSENLLDHMETVVDELDMTPVEQKTFRESLKTASGMLANRQIQKLKAPITPGGEKASMPREGIGKARVAKK